MCTITDLENTCENESDIKKRDALSKYLSCAFTPWKSHELMWEYNTNGLISLCREWDFGRAP